MKGKTNT